MLLDIEDPAEYQAVLDCGINEFRPHSITALRLVEALHHLDWLIARVNAMESAYLNHKVNRVLEVPLPNPIEEANAENGDSTLALLLGWINSTGGHGNMHDLMRGYSASLQSRYNATLKNYFKLEDRHCKRALNPDFTDPYIKPELPEPEPPKQPQDREDEIAPIENKPELEPQSIAQPDREATAKEDEIGHENEPEPRRKLLVLLKHPNSTKPEVSCAT